jgi:hypothetical protein
VTAFTESGAKTAPSVAATGPAGPAGPKGDKGDAAIAPSVRVTCDLSANRRQVVCTVTAVKPSSSATKLSTTVRLQGSKTTATKAGKGKVKVTLRSSKRLKKTTKVVVKVTSGKSVTSYTVKSR